MSLSLIWNQFRIQHQRSVPKNMWNKNLIIAGILLTGLLLGCGIGGPDTFVRFEIEDQSYEVKDPTFVVTRLIEGFQFFDLQHNPMGSIPGAMVQWQMKVESPKKLVGQNLDLNTVESNNSDPMVLLRLTEDLTLQNQKNSNVHFRIDRIEEGMAEGSFSATGLKYVSNKQKKNGKVDITAQFRVKLVEKKWEDALRSSKRVRK